MSQPPSPDSQSPDSQSPEVPPPDPALPGLSPAPPGSDATTATDAQPGVGAPVSGAALVDPDLLEADLGDPDQGVPTLDAVRDRIEGRFGRALGATELAGNTPEAKRAAERQRDRERAAADKLAELRAAVDRDRQGGPA
ncbi:hypothetical protein [Nakamurella leprariae]|uniref:Uncharacterized protein n=1 Tax=Nakamurella leprariae TaxID=2803911 RepID=A0A938YA82_9ACTN|nr:hypothetical protein [Nakamurella leprariae]MBM9468811.1 hypothetical protein [Nakamurella leprariae]